MDTSVETPNPAPATRIELTNGVQNIKELYYKDGNGSIFTYRKTRKTLRWAGFLASLSSYFYFRSFSDQVEWIVLFALTTMVLIFFVILFVIQATAYFRWKNNIDACLKEVGRYTQYTLVLGAQSFEVIHDDESTIEKWGNIIKASIHSTYITLYSGSAGTYIFPAKSMNSSEYETLKEMIHQKVGTSNSSKQ